MDTIKIESRMVHLQMIQGLLDRMSTMSAIFKGFAATNITAISAISFCSINDWVFLLSMVPIISFLFMDIYYLSIERKYRMLYEKVRDTSYEADFSMNIKSFTKADLCKGKARMIDCFKSISILMFYIPLLIVALFVIVMNFRKII